MGQRRREDLATTEQFESTCAITAGKLKLTPEERTEFESAMQGFADGPAVLQVRRGTAAAVRSLKASKYYWSIIERIRQRTPGNSKDAIHDAMCDLFLKYTVHVINAETGEVLERQVAGRSSGLSPEQFYDFVEQVRQWAAEFFDMDIPDPDPLWRTRAA